MAIFSTTGTFLSLIFLSMLNVITAVTKKFCVVICAYHHNNHQSLVTPYYHHNHQSSVTHRLLCHHHHHHCCGCSWWHHQMETFSALLAVVSGIHRSLVNSPHKGQWRRALMFSLVCVWTNSWANSLDAGDLRCHRAHYHFTVMFCHCCHWCHNQYPHSLIAKDHQFDILVIPGGTRICHNDNLRCHHGPPGTTNLSKLTSFCLQWFIPCQSIFWHVNPFPLVILGPFYYNNMV